MNSVKTLIIVCVMVIVVVCGCTSRRAERASAKSDNAQTKVSQERLKLVEDYKKCIKKAGEDKNKIEACDTYLKAAETLK